MSPHVAQRQIYGRHHTSGEQLNRIQKILTHKCGNSGGELFEECYQETDPVVLGYIDRLYGQLVLKDSVDIAAKQVKSKRPNGKAGKDWQTIDLNSLRNRDVQGVGGERLCYQALMQLNIIGFLSGLGNASDPSTLETMINNLRLKTSGNAKKAVFVMDAGIATEANLAMVREKGYDYLCVTRSTMKDHILQGDKDDILTITDNRKQKIALHKERRRFARQ